MIKSRARLGEILLEEEESTESEGTPKTSGNTKAEGSDAQVKQCLIRSSIPTAATPIKLADSRKRSRIELYKIIYSTSPKDFQVAPLVDVLPWDGEMQKFYGDANNREDFEIKTSCVLVGRLYACKCNTWYRVKIVDVDLIREMAHVFFIDFDTTQLVHMDSLLELCSEFWSWPASIYKAELLNVVPANGQLHWSDGALREFQAICKPGQIFLGFIPEIRHTKLGQKSSLPLILFDVKFYDLTVSIQQQLIQGNFADPCNEMDLNKVFNFKEADLKIPASPSPPGLQDLLHVPPPLPPYLDFKLD